MSGIDVNSISVNRKNETDTDLSAYGSLEGDDYVYSEDDVREVIADVTGLDAHCTEIDEMICGLKNDGDYSFPISAEELLEILDHDDDDEIDTTDIDDVEEQYVTDEHDASSEESGSADSGSEDGSDDSSPAVMDVVNRSKDSEGNEISDEDVVTYDADGDGKFSESEIREILRDVGDDQDSSYSIDNEDAIINALKNNFGGDLSVSTDDLVAFLDTDGDGEFDGVDAEGLDGDYAGTEYEDDSEDPIDSAEDAQSADPIDDAEFDSVAGEDGNPDSVSHTDISAIETIGGPGPYTRSELITIFEELGVSDSDAEATADYMIEQNGGNDVDADFIIDEISDPDKSTFSDNQLSEYVTEAINADDGENNGDGLTADSPHTISGKQWPDNMEIEDITEAVTDTGHDFGADDKLYIELGEGTFYIEKMDNATGTYVIKDEQGKVTTIRSEGDLADLSHDVDGQQGVFNKDGKTYYRDNDADNTEYEINSTNGEIISSNAGGAGNAGDAGSGQGLTADDPYQLDAQYLTNIDPADIQDAAAATGHNFDTDGPLYVKTIGNTEPFIIEKTANGTESYVIKDSDDDEAPRRVVTTADNIIDLTANASGGNNLIYQDDGQHYYKEDDDTVYKIGDNGYLTENTPSDLGDIDSAEYTTLAESSSSSNDGVIMGHDIIALSGLDSNATDQGWHEDMTADKIDLFFTTLGISAANAAVISDTILGGDPDGAVTVKQFQALINEFSPDNAEYDSHNLREDVINAFIDKVETDPQSVTDMVSTIQTRHPDSDGSATVNAPTTPVTSGGGADVTVNGGDGRQATPFVLEGITSPEELGEDEIDAIFANPSFVAGTDENMAYVEIEGVSYSIYRATSSYRILNSAEGTDRFEFRTDATVPNLGEVSSPVSTFPYQTENGNEYVYYDGGQDKFFLLEEDQTNGGYIVTDEAVAIDADGNIDDNVLAGGGGGSISVDTTSFNGIASGDGGTNNEVSTKDIGIAAGLGESVTNATELDQTNLETVLTEFGVDPAMATTLAIEILGDDTTITIGEFRQDIAGDDVTTTSGGRRGNRGTTTTTASNFNQTQLEAYLNGVKNKPTLEALEQKASSGTLSQEEADDLIALMRSGLDKIDLNSDMDYIDFITNDLGGGDPELGAKYLYAFREEFAEALSNSYVGQGRPDDALGALENVFYHGGNGDDGDKIKNFEDPDNPNANRDQLFYDIGVAFKEHPDITNSNKGTLIGKMESDGLKDEFKDGSGYTSGRSNNGRGSGGPAPSPSSGRGRGRGRGNR